MTTHSFFVFQWKPDDLESAGRIIGTLTGNGVAFRHPSGTDGTTTLLIDTPRGEVLAEPGDWLVSADASAWQVTRDSASAIRAAAKASGYQLGDPVEYDARTVSFPDGPHTAPGGRGRLADVFAAGGEVVARVQHEDGTSDAPLLTDLRPAPTETVPGPRPAAQILITDPIPDGASALEGMPGKTITRDAAQP